MKKWFLFIIVIFYNCNNFHAMEEKGENESQLKESEEQAIKDKSIKTNKIKSQLSINSLVFKPVKNNIEEILHTNNIITAHIAQKGVKTPAEIFVDIGIKEADHVKEISSYHKESSYNYIVHSNHFFKIINTTFNKIVIKNLRQEINNNICSEFCILKPGKTLQIFFQNVVKKFINNIKPSLYYNYNLKINKEEYQKYFLFCRMSYNNDKNGNINFMLHDDNDLSEDLSLIMKYNE